MVWFIILSILWKNNPEHARKNCRVLQVVRRDGEFFYYPHGICFGALHRKKIVFRWNDAPFAPKWDQIKRE